MFIDRMLNQGNGPMLEQWLRFTEARHRLIGENVVNLSTPGYQQKDLNVGAFQSMLRERAESRDAGDDVRFDDITMDIEDPERGLLFHDGQTRSTEQLMTDQAKNALMHNLVVELLRKQFSALDMALKERPT
jgi:flagellar basal body rod protein FlgB